MQITLVSMMRPLLLLLSCAAASFSSSSSSMAGDVTTTTSSSHRWVRSNAWSKCSKSCGRGGVQTLRFVCVRRGEAGDRPANSSSTGDAACAAAPPTVSRQCYHGDCAGLVWRVQSSSTNNNRDSDGDGDSDAEWSRCSRACGPDGLQRREVECVLWSRGLRDFVQPENGEQDCVSAGKSRNFTRPVSQRACNTEFDCAPVYIYGKWGKCKRAFGCQPGTQRRRAQCVTLSKSGKLIRHATRLCFFSLKRGPQTWQNCFEQQTDACNDQNLRKTEIKTVADEKVEQMRSMRKLKLTVGQIAYVIPYTKIFIQCPVTNFQPKHLVWYHLSERRDDTRDSERRVRYRGNRRARVHVSKSGELRIKRFRAELDGGWWECRAERQDGRVLARAKILLKWRSRSAGLYDWNARRHLISLLALRNRMQLDTTDRRVTRLPQWVVHEWGACSVSCGKGVGVQRRRVTCEIVSLSLKVTRIKSHEYCQTRHKLGAPPTTSRSCRTAAACPHWQLSPRINYEKCSAENCQDVGLGSFQGGSVTCVFKQRPVYAGNCDATQKPMISCSHADCQLDWNISKWSKCSKSCGGEGIQARYFTCVWKRSRSIAGNLCFAKSLPPPRAIRKCVAPPCILKCADLSSNCLANRYLCAIPIYRYQCCSSCKHIRK